MIHEKMYQDFVKNNTYQRQLKRLENHQGVSFYQGKKMINFASNDYLGLSHHPLLIERSQEYAARYGVGVSSSRLVTGNYDFYEKIEEKLARALGKPAALIMGTGFQTNCFVLEALLNKKILGEEPLVFCDKLNHVSMIATTRHMTKLIRFQHNNLQHLSELLEKYAHSSRPKFILVESIYSMDGDQADLNAISQLAEDYNAFLYVDDAHAVGLYGKTGWGIASDLSDKIPVMMGTFSKALGSFGGYVACSENIKKYLVNQCKGLIYSTGLSPAVLGAMDAAIDLLPELAEKRARLIHISNQVREFFQSEKLDCGQSTTHIIPWIIGDAKTARKISLSLENRGILATAIQPPTVPRGSSRLRFCLSASHLDEDIDYLFESLLLTR